MGLFPAPEEREASWGNTLQKSQGTDGPHSRTPGVTPTSFLSPWRMLWPGTQMASRRGCMTIWGMLVSFQSQKSERLHPNCSPPFPTTPPTLHSSVQEHGGSTLQRKGAQLRSQAEMASDGPVSPAYSPENEQVFLASWSLPFLICKMWK